MNVCYKIHATSLAAEATTISSIISPNRSGIFVTPLRVNRLVVISYINHWHY